MKFSGTRKLLLVLSTGILILSMVTVGIAQSKGKGAGAQNAPGQNNPPGTSTEVTVQEQFEDVHTVQCGDVGPFWVRYETMDRVTTTTTTTVVHRGAKGSNGVVLSTDVQTAVTTEPIFGFAFGAFPSEAACFANQE
jgi:hypothetical protein